MTESDVSSARDPVSAPRRCAIVTGGSQGIGAAVVEAFRRDGYAVVAAALAMDQPSETAA